MKIHRPHLLKHTFNVVNRVRQTASVAGLSALRVAKGEKPDAMLLKETFEQLGTTYIKIGQFIASTPSLFPREYVEAFQSCLDQTTPLSYAYIEQVLKEELPPLACRLKRFLLILTKNHSLQRLLPKCMPRVYIMAMK